ncbi:hypothetical protein EDD16DRAFT_1714922 [Pisolithus croceorrhizus]|nr:hypothetical protein EDD16DRAFT_1714922 [Pisolithus croceorrhizus]KAI6132688.1 hypothetical protein EV401DRAFT_1849365 [Pisolithus croceorrhizus]KAI6158785.1 hypothetical protein EDD17DRAFT_1488141 [Pisolithus thermaeus]
MEGKVDEHPIHLEGLSTDVFDIFVQFKFGRPCPCEAYTNKDLKDFLEFTRKFQCSSFTHDFVISRIKQRHYLFHPSELIHISINYEIPDLFTLGFNRLVQTPWTDIENIHRDYMGSEVFTTLVYVKALLDEHCRIVAAEPPLMQHAPNCPNKQACTEDWRAVWWNGMGRLLLDARNPQPFDEAFERFRLLEFGRVGSDCKKVMFTQVMSINIPRIHATKFVDNVRDRLLKKLLP